MGGPVTPAGDDGSEHRAALGAHGREAAAARQGAVPQPRPLAGGAGNGMNSPYCCMAATSFPLAEAVCTLPMTLVTWPGLSVKSVWAYTATPFSPELLVCSARRCTAGLAPSAASASPPDTAALSCVSSSARRLPLDCRETGRVGVWVPTETWRGTGGVGDSCG